MISKSKYLFMIQKPHQELFTRAWRMSTDCKEQVRGNAITLFGENAIWTRGFDFKKPVENFRNIKGIRFMTINHQTKMYLIKHNGDIDSDISNEIKKTLLQEIENSTTSEKGICGWVKERKYKLVDFSIRTIKEIGNGLYCVYHDDGGDYFVNSSNQRLHFNMPPYEFILGCSYLGKYDNLDVFVIKSTDWASGMRGLGDMGFYDMNGKSISFYKELAKINCYCLDERGYEIPKKIEQIEQEFAKLITPKKSQILHQSSRLKPRSLP